MPTRPHRLTAKLSPFTTFCEGPEDIQEGFRLFLAFYRRNYQNWLPPTKESPILVLSSGPGYFQQFLKEQGYTNVVGIDTNPANVAVAKGRGLVTECASSFDWLPRSPSLDMIFGEQEINHLTRSELLELLSKGYASLRPGGRLILVAANCTNPIVGPEHAGNNWDHYLFTTEGNLSQIFRHAGYREVTAFPLDFYVVWYNPLNYVARAVTGTLHLGMRIIFRIYGKNAKIFTKRLGITGQR